MADHYHPADGLPSPTKIDEELLGEHSMHDEVLVVTAAATAEPEDGLVAYERKRKHDQMALEENMDEEEAKRLKLDEAAAKKINNEQWEEMFRRLCKYKEEHGDCLVPKRYQEDPKLGTWVETQRVQRKRLATIVDEASGMETVAPNKRLNQERLEKLESIGFAWSAKFVRKVKLPSSTNGRPKKPENGDMAKKNRLNDEQWDQMYQRLVAYKEKHGDCLVPRRYEEDPKLAGWCETQRALWNRDYREASSLSIPEPSSVADAKSPEEWADEMAKGATAEDAAELAATMAVDVQMIEQDESAAGETGAESASEGAPEDMESPTSEGEGLVKLPTGSAAPKRLTKERKEKLDALGFVWSLRSKRVDDHWDTMFQKLVEYKEQHGDCLVPSRYEVEPKLGKWVETQRYEYTKLQRAQNGTVDPKDEIDTGSKDGKPRASNPRLTEERLRRLNSIGFSFKVKHKMKRYYDKQWDSMFQKLLAFREEHGHCVVPKRYLSDLRLGTWVHTQRIQYRKMMAGKGGVPDTASDNGSEVEALIPKGEEEISYRLTEERRKRLEEIGFCWSARELGEKGAEQGKMTRNSYDDQWDQMFDQLREYRDKYGDCLVPKRFKENTRLGTWVDTQRVQYKKMKKKLAAQGIDYKGPYPGEGQDQTNAMSEKPLVGRLTDERIRRLESIGFVWSLRDDWQKHYDELKQYKEEHGHCNVPARYAKNRRLGIWVSAQRQQYKILQAQTDSKPRRSAPLTADRIELLNKLGFTWTIRSRDSLGESWNQRLNELAKFRTMHGHCNVPSRYPLNPELGVWVGTQRTQKRLYDQAKEAGEDIPRNSAMNEERIRQLEDLGFSWSLRGPEGKREFGSDSGSLDAAGVGAIEPIEAAVEGPRRDVYAHAQSVHVHNHHEEMFHHGTMMEQADV